MTSTVYSSMPSAINRTTIAATMWDFAIATPASENFGRCSIAIFRKSRTISIGQFMFVSSREVAAEIGELIHRLRPHAGYFNYIQESYRRHHVGVEHGNWPSLADVALFGKRQRQSCTQ